MNDQEWKDLSEEEQIKAMKIWAKALRDSFSDEEWKKMGEQAELDIQ